MKTVSQKISDEEIRKIVLARLKTYPSGRKISIGSQGSFSKDDLIKHVNRVDEIGIKIIEIQLQFLRSFKKDLLFENE